MTRPLPVRRFRLFLAPLLALGLSCERIDPLRAGPGGEAAELGCEGCHGSPTLLAALAGGSAERVLLGDESFAALDTTHGPIGCVTCHGGVEPVSAAGASAQELATAMAQAHEGMARDPSAEPERNCSGSGCHGAIVETFAASLHGDLGGMKSQVALRAGFDSWEECPELLKEGFRADCASCHASCGQCHVSRPTTAGGGLLAGHRFQRRPGTEATCAACHSHTVGVDFLGQAAGSEPDIHGERGLDCLDCHQESLHGDGASYDSRHAVAGQPRCTDCHAGAAGANLYHEYHWPGASIVAGLACTVCHSQPYNNCLNCHAGGDTGGAVVDFRIGRNGGQRPGHPVAAEEWVTVRHAPVAPDSYAAWGWPQLADWAARETWLPASPHNIRRFTPQTAAAQANPDYSMADCWMSCHVQGPHEEANAGRFLWLSHLDSLKSMITGLADLEEYVRANRRVAVDDSLTRWWNRH
jgi:thiosulfate/3-mercaptopyruvate sulfurtransferase